MKVRSIAGIAGATVALAAFAVTAPVPSQASVNRHVPSCRTELAAYRLVSRQAGLRIGSAHIYEGVLETSPRTWARELRRAGDYPLAATALGIRDRQSDRDFVLAITASAVAALQGNGCS